MSDYAIKHDENKARFDLIPAEELFTLAKVYTYGAKEYGDRNMDKGLRWGRVFAAVMRHLWKFWAGEQNDQKSGLPHLAHAAWGCFTLLSYSNRGDKQFDDQPKYEEREKKK